MLLTELCPCLSRHLAISPALLLRRRVAPAPALSRPCSASLGGTAADDAEPRHQSARGRPPGVTYEEPAPCRPATVMRFLRRELELGWTRAERQAARHPQLAAAGVYTMTENLLFLTEHGVTRQDLQDDIDILGVRHSDLVRIHGLMGRLPGAEYRLYYPLSRARRDTVTELFRRLPTRRSNLVQELAQTLHLPVLTVSRAVSRMAALITKSSNTKLLRNANLLMELGVPPVELSRSLYVLRLPGPRIRRREQQCRRHGIPLHPVYLGISEADFQRRLAQGGRLTERTADTEAMVARRLGVSRQEVLDRTCNSDVLQALTTARFEAVTALLQRAGYSPQDLLSALASVYRRPPERISDRLETCRQLGRPLPAVSVLACHQRRFDRMVAIWRREAGLEARLGGADSGALEADLETWDELDSVPEVAVDSAGEEEVESMCEGEGELGDVSESEVETESFKRREAVRESYDVVDFVDALELQDDYDVRWKAEAAFGSDVEMKVEGTEALQDDKVIRREMRDTSKNEAEVDITPLDIRNSADIERQLEEGSKGEPEAAVEEWKHDSGCRSAGDNLGRGGEVEDDVEDWSKIGNTEAGRRSSNTPEQ